MIYFLGYAHSMVVVAFDHNLMRIGHTTVGSYLEGWEWAKKKRAVHYELRHRTGRYLGRWHIDTNPVTGCNVSST